MTEKKSHGGIPKTVMHKGVKYHLFDTQWSLKNARAAAQLYASIGPKSAKYIISSDKTAAGHEYHAVYCSIPVTVERKKK